MARRTITWYYVQPHEWAEGTGIIIFSKSSGGTQTSVMTEELHDLDCFNIMQYQSYEEWQRACDIYLELDKNK